MAKLFANSIDLDQMPHSAVSDLGRHCLPNNFWNRLMTVTLIVYLKLFLMLFSTTTFYFSKKIRLRFHVNRLPSRWFARKTKPYFLRKINKKTPIYISGSRCSKLMMSLLNISLKLWSLNIAYMLIFLLQKMWIAFAFSKNYSLFFSIPMNLILFLLEQLTFWPLISLLS